MAFAVGHRTQAGAVEYANALQRIVSNGGAIGEVPRERRVVGGIGGGVVKNEYNGYFKIIDASEYDEEGDLQKVIIKVVDGQTYSAETGESESMLYYTNGNPGQVQSTTIELQKRSQIVGLMLHVSASGDANIETYTGSPPSQTPHHFYKGFGRVEIKYASIDGKNGWLVNIYQDHDIGALEGTWYAICGVFAEV